jgi:hypothetical protein
MLEFVRGLMSEQGVEPAEFEDLHALRFTACVEVAGRRVDFSHNLALGAPADDFVFVRVPVCAVPDHPPALELLLKSALVASQRMARQHAGCFALEPESGRLVFRAVQPLGTADAASALAALADLSSALEAWRIEQGAACAREEA